MTFALGSFFAIAAFIGGALVIPTLADHKASWGARLFFAGLGALGAFAGAVMAMAIFAEVF